MSQDTSTLLTLWLNGKRRQFNDIATVTDLLTHLGYVGKRVAVERNGEIVPRSQHEQTALQPDDRLEVVVAVGGG